MVWLDCLNQWLFSFEWIQGWCLLEVKRCLFVIKGNCQHSGYCCKHLHIKRHGTWITRWEQFERLVRKNAVFKRFTPVGSFPDIDYFHCESLSEVNICQDYDNRPDFCQDYPFSAFYSEGSLYEGCGYFVVQDMRLPAFASDFLKQEVSVICFNNRVGVEQGA